MSETAKTTATISATLNGTTVSTPLTIQPASVTYLTVLPNPVVGGNNATGAVTINGPAPSGGLVVTLASSSGDAIVPSQVTVAGGSISANFTVVTKAVSADVTATIAATFGSGTQSVQLIIHAGSLGALTVSPVSVVGGSKTTLTGTLSLTGPLLSTAVVKLKSSDTAIATVPASVSLAHGLTAVTFPVTHRLVKSTETVTITATYGGDTESAVLTVTPFEVTSFAISPTTVAGGSNATGTLELNAEPGGSGPIVVKLTSSSKAVEPPASAVVAVGKTSASFAIKTKGVSSTTSATVTASYGSSSQLASLTVTAPVLVSVSVSPASVKGSAGTAVTGTVTLSGPAPLGGLIVSLSSSDPSAAAVPATVTVPTGTTFVKFSVKHSKVASSVSVTITATLSVTAKTTTLTVTP